MYRHDSESQVFVSHLPETGVLDHVLKREKSLQNAIFFLRRYEKECAPNFGKRFVAVSVDTEYDKNMQINVIVKTHIPFVSFE